MTALSGRAVSGVAAMPRRLPAFGDAGAAIASAAATAGVIALAAGGATVLLRRMVGGFAEPPSIGLPWLALVFGIAVITTIDIASRAGVIGRWASLVGRFGLLVTVLALVPIPHSAGGLFVALMPLGVAATAVMLPAPGRLRRRARPGVPMGVPEPRKADAVSAAPLPTGFRQRLERFQTPTDGDRIIGRVLVDVAVGTRTGHAHLGFCPPFAAVPTVEVTCDDDGIEAVVTAAEVVPWGVRVECRLSEPAEDPLTIPVDVVASHPA